MGIKGKDFVVVVGDTSATQQIITIKHDEDKLVPIDSHKLMCLSGTSQFISTMLLGKADSSRKPGHMLLLNGVSLAMPAGEPGDRVQFSEFIMANVRLYALRHDKALSTHAVAHFTRSELATALRKVLHLIPTLFRTL